MAPPPPCMASFLSAPTLLPHLCMTVAAFNLCTCSLPATPLLSPLHLTLHGSRSFIKAQAGALVGYVPALPYATTPRPAPGEGPSPLGMSSPPQSPLSLPSQGQLPHTLWGAPQPLLVSGKVTTGQRPQVHLCAVLCPVAPQLLPLDGLSL